MHLAHESTTARYHMIIVFVALLLATSGNNGATPDSTVSVDSDTPRITDSMIPSSISGDAPPSSGTWTIDEATVITNEVILVNGSINLVAGGSLTISNSELLFNSDGAAFTIQRGTTLDMSECTLNTVSSSHWYTMSFVQTGSGTQDAEISDTEITNCATVSSEFDGGLVTFDTVYFSNWTGYLMDIYYGNTTISNCDFNDPDLSGSTYLSGYGTFYIHTLSSMHDHTIIDGCTFRNLYHSGPGDEVIYISDDGYVSITNNEFYNIQDADGGSGDSTLLWIQDNAYIASNHFYNNWGIPIRVRGENVTISSNNFESHYDYNVFVGSGVDFPDSIWGSPCAILLDTFHPDSNYATDVLIENNRIFDWPGSGIVAAHDSYNNTIRNNLIQSVSDAGIYFIQEAHNYTVTGNLLANSNIGVDITAQCENLTLFKNAFVNNTILAVDRNSTARGISWDNSTYGNIWADHAGVDSNNDWVIDTTRTDATNNVTDSLPAMMIGEFAPGSGTWTIDKPHMFYLKDVGDIYANIVVTGVAGVFGMLGAEMNIDSGHSFTLNEETTLFLIESVIQERTSSSTFTFNVDNIFNWLTWNSRISNITSSLTIETRYFTSWGCTFHEIPGFKISMYAYYNFTFQGAIPVYLNDNMLTNITGNIIINREVEFTNNSITFENPSSSNWVNIGTQHSDFEFDDPEHFIVDDNQITGGRLNLTTGYAYCSVVDNYAELGFRLNIGEGAHDRFFNISGNTADQNEMYFYVEIISGASSTKVDMNNNTLGSGTLTVWCNGGLWHAGFDMLYTTHNSGTLDINAAVNGNIQYLNHVSGPTDMVNVQGATFNHCSFGGTVDIANSASFDFLNGHIYGEMILDYVDGSCINSTEFHNSWLAITHTHGMVLAHNTFYDYSGESWGQIYLNRADNIVIYDNDFVNVTKAVQLWNQCDFCVIEGNTMDLNGYEGVKAGYDCQNLTIRNNIIANGSYGVQITYDSPYSWNSTIVGNEFRDLTMFAVRIEGGNYHVVSYNTIHNVSNTAIMISATGYPTVEYNTIWDIIGNGIDVTGGYAEVSHNRVTNCTSTGIYLRSGGSDYYYLVMQNNSVTFCDYGVYIGYVYRDATIFNNTLAFNAVWGMYIDTLYDSQIWLNYFYENGAGSIYIYWGGSNQLDNGAVGNFYPEYRGSESGTPWIGSDPYQVIGANSDVRGIDNHPIMGMGALTPSSGDWVVDRLTIILGVSRSIDGDIIITGTGNLTLIGTEIEFTTGGTYWSTIKIMTGGSLRATEGVVFTSDQVSQTYGLCLQTDATLYMHDVTIDRCGYPDNFNDPAFKINVTDVSLSNMTFSSCYTGIVLRLVDGLSFTDMHFVNCYFGISITSDDAVVDGFSFDNVQFAIDASVCENITVRNCDFEGVVDYALYFAAVDNCYIYNNKFVDITTCIRLNSLCDNNEIYMNFFSGSTTYLSDTGTGNTMNNGTHGNFYLDYAGADADGNLIGNTAYNENGVNDPYPLMVYGSWPTVGLGWDVTEDTWCLATNFTLNGDVTIYDGATLMVLDATLWFNCSSDREFGLFVNNGGAFNLTDGSLRAYSINHHFDVYADSQSLIRMVGTLLNGSYRIQTRTNETYLNYLTIQNSETAVYLQGTSGSSYLYGLSLEMITISDSMIGLYMDYCYYCTISECTISGCNYGLRANYALNLVVDHCDFTDITSDALNIFRCTQTTVRHITVDHASVGVYLDNHAYGHTVIEDSVISHVSTGINYISSTNEGNTLLIDNVTVNSATTRGVYAMHADEVVITDSDFNVHGGIMINFYYDVAWFEVSHCTGFNGSWGVRLTHSSGRVDYCDFLNFTYGVGFQYENNGQNVTVNENLFWGCSDGINCQDCGSCLINVTGNEFQYCNYAMTNLDGLELLVAYNTITDCQYGLYANGGTHDADINHNTYLDCDRPIYIYSGIHGTSISHEDISNCELAIYLRYSDNLTLSSIMVNGYSQGIQAYYCENVTLDTITLQNGEQGVYLYGSELVTMRDCTISDTYEGLLIEAWDEDTAHHDIDDSNYFKGKPIYYFFNETGTTHSGLDTYHLGIAYCEWMTVTDSDIAGDKLFLMGLANCTLANSTINANFTTNIVHDLLVYGNVFDSSGTIRFNRAFADTNLTFTLNSFMSAYGFYLSDSQWIMNRTDYGNYWYNYVGTDVDHDGIGDTTFYAASGMPDYLPLMAPPNTYTVIPEIIMPSEDASVGGLVAVEISTYLILGVFYEGTPSVVVTVDANGTNVWTGAGGAQSFSFDSTSFADGLYILTLTAVVDGSDTYTEYTKIYLDNTGPDLSQLSPQDGYSTSSSSMDISGWIEDDLSHLSWIAYIVNGSLKHNTTDIAMKVTWAQYTVNFDSEGAYNVTIISEDVAGARSVLKRIYFHDNSAPILSEPEDPEIEYGEGGTIVWTIDDLTPYYYNITMQGTDMQNGLITGNSVEFSIPLGLGVGYHTVYITVYDHVGYSSSDYVSILVTEASTTTTTTTTTDTSTTSTDTTGTGTPPPPDFDMLPLLLVISVGGIFAVVIVIFIMKKKATS